MLKGLTHLLHFSGWHEGDWVPVPLIVDDAVVESNGPVRGDQVVRKGALASRQNVQLLGAFLQMNLGSRSVSTPDVDGGVPGQVGYKVPLWSW
jgi:hypothetical protein